EPAPALPYDRPRPARRSFAGAVLEERLPRALADALQGRSREAGATLFMTLLAGFTALLHRYTGRDHVVVGAPTAGRGRREVEGLVGFFVNTLVLRTDSPGDPTFRELLATVRRSTLDAYAHQDVPFDRLVEELHPDRDPNAAPLFQVMFTLQNAQEGALSLAGVDVSPLQVGRHTAKFDLSLSVTETARGLEAAFHYSTDLFDAATIGRMAGHLRALLEQAAADPEVRVSEIELLAPSERELLRRCGENPSPPEPSDCLHSLVEEQAARTPEAAAVLWEGGTLTYAELDRRANRLARHLARRGVGLESRVGIHLERSPEMVVAVLAVLKAGGAYVPLDPGAPVGRLRQTLEDSGARALVTRAGLAGWADGFEGALVRLDADREAIGAEDGEAPASGVGPENLAYVIYTSGSTGTPKGVLVEHRSVVNYLRWFDREVMGEEGYALPLLSRLSFDAHVRQLYPPLLRGDAAWIVSDETVADPAALLQAISTRERVAFGGVPALWSAVVDHLSLRDEPVPPAVSALLLGGGTLTPDLVERSLALRPELRIWNHYGPTETTVNASAGRVERGVRLGIGRPVANVRVHLLDGGLRPVPVGVPGELYAGGAAVARGYLGRPGLTAERFLPDPFSPEPGARMYRTGDRARWRDDGTLEFLGRVDDQVKIRGFRVEPGEIEAVLQRHPAVARAAVVPHAGASGEARLAGYLLPRPGSGLDPAALRAHLREHLPEYMVPSTLVVLEELPLLSSGKVDRRALPAPGPDRHDPHASGAPRDPLELRIAQTWEEVLGVRAVGVAESFFDLGGHSLLAVQLVARLGRLLGRRIPVALVFEAPTVQEMASRLRGEGGGEVCRHLPVQLQAGNGSGHPLFIVHPVGGGILCYLGLARALPGRPVYGLQAGGLHDGRVPRASVPELAARYVAAVREIQPEGPYLLAGWSFGGKVAFEMAHLLRREGAEVAFLGLIDTHARRGRHDPDAMGPGDLVPLFAKNLGGVVGQDLDISPDTLRGMSRREQLDHLMEQVRASGLVPPGTGARQMRRFLAVFRENLRASHRYQAPGYEGPITLIRAGDQPAWAGDDPTLGWDRLTSVAVHEIPGDHYTLFHEPRVQLLARTLAACLEEACPTLPPDSRR
ncbi:MAG TPA: amino acid adenylation domain-containing protein, partial [Longimicrobiaceae bacterium]|nr:amino acid adenylation domain-containing protein [Longimicrobiaceae bacterium]